MADTLHVGNVNILNHDVESSYFSAFLESMSLNTEYGISGTPKRCVYVCNEIERIEHKYQLIEREIKKSGVRSNVIIALDIDDRYKNREIEISRRNESIFTAVVRMTSIGRVVSRTDLIKYIIQSPETPISTIIDEFVRNRNNADQEKKSGIFYRLSGFITSKIQAQSHDFKTILKQKQMEDQKSLEDMKNQLKVLLEKINNMEKEMERGNKSENMIEQYHLLLQQLEFMIIQHEDKVTNMKGKQESHVEELQNLVMEHIKKVEKMQREQELYVQELKNSEKEHKEKLELHLQQSQNTEME